MIKFFCEQCKRKMGVEDSFAGRRVKCTRCTQVNVVPGTRVEPEGVPDRAKRKSSSRHDSSGKKSKPAAAPFEPAPPVEENVFAKAAAELEGDGGFELNEPPPAPVAPPRPKRASTTTAVAADVSATAAVAPANVPTATGPETFGLHPAAGAAVAVFILAMAFIHRNDFGDNAVNEVSHSIGVMSGELIGGLAISLGVAYAAFRFGSPTRKVASIVFSVMILLIIVSTGNGAVERERVARLKAMKAKMASATAALNVPGEPMSERMKKVTALAELTGQAAEFARGEEKIMLGVVADYNRWESEIWLPYLSAMERVKESGAATINTIKSREDLAQRVALVKAWEQSWSPYSTGRLGLSARLRERLASTSLSEEQKSQLHGTLTRNQDQKKLAIELSLEHDASIAVRNVLGLLLSEWDQIERAAEGSVTGFKTPETTAKFNEHMSKLQSLFGSGK